MNKNTSYILYALLLVLISMSCQENINLKDYDVDQSYIYFAQPNTDSRSPEKWADSIRFSFALQPEQLDEKVIAVPLHVSGLAAHQDRKFAYSVNKELSDADMDIVHISDPVIHAGAYTDTLYVTIQNTPNLSDRVMDLVLDLHDNENFKVGHQPNARIRLTFTNQLLEPEWWKTWESVFGPYHPEVYQLWMQIYYLGADPSPDLYGSAPGPFYYWDNMPPTAVFPSWFPVTFMYVDILRDYLEKNPVYPNGDTTQERIYLP